MKVFVQTLFAKNKTTSIYCSTKQGCFRVYWNVVSNGSSGKAAH